MSNTSLKQIAKEIISIKKQNALLSKAIFALKKKFIQKKDALEAKKTLDKIRA